MYYAHSTPSLDRSDWQELAQHLRQVAQLASHRGDKFGAANATALAGWLHDLGKYAEAYQLYIQGCGASVDHSTAGAKEILKLTSANLDKAMAQLIAYAIAGHHTGLPDKEGEIGSLSSRLKKSTAPLDPIWQGEIEVDATGLLPIGFTPHPDKALLPFQLAFLGRMIFSCLVDADFLDTEAFYAAVDGRSVDRQWPSFSEHLDKLLMAFDAHMLNKQRHAGDTPLNQLRKEILEHVREKAALAPGVFTLNVPTGGGKTLASLGFALDHAKRWKMDRVIYAIPFTSIIDQTATVFQDVLGSDVVLEHHSAIEPETGEKEDKFRRGAPDAKLRLAMENWQAPIVVTTNVQLFESLFADRPSRCRKLHNLAKSVIVLDEAQTIPLPVLRPCVAALDELARNYGCTVVLCTATQPALKEPRFKGGLIVDEKRELAPDPSKLHRALKRTTERLAGTMADSELLADVSTVEQALVIVNTRAHALALYRRGREAQLDGLLHLSTRQVAADRRRILGDVRRRLKAGLPCRVIATSLIEAGVDVSFPRVWRAEAGLDQIIQAAGRCNREWEWPVSDSIVTVFRPADAKPQSEIAAFAAAMHRVADKHGDDLFSQAAIMAYFEEVYWQRGDALDKHKIVEGFRVSRGEPSFPYRTVAEKFRLIESGMEPVIVAAEENAKHTLLALKAGLPPAAAARRLQNYIVQVPPKDRAKLIDNGHVRLVDEQFAVLTTESFYTRDIGLLWEEADSLGEESWFV